VALAIDLAVAGFVHSALPLAGSFGRYLLLFSPIALAVSVVAIWVASVIRMRLKTRQP
jgi:hypothetical protein